MYDNTIIGSAGKQEKITPIKFYYLLQCQGSLSLRMTAESARKNGAIAEFTHAGWVYQKKEEAEEAARRWSQGNRKVKAVRWFEPLLDKVWFGSKKESKLAKKKISAEISRRILNKKKQSIEDDCLKQGLHPSWLYREHLQAGMSIQENQIHAKYRPLFEKSFEEEENARLNESDIAREDEDALEYVPGEEVIIDSMPKKIIDMPELNRRFAQLEAPGQPCVFISRKEAIPISQQDFNRRTKGYVVLVGADENNNPKYMSAGKFWEGNCRKCIYKKIAFTNKENNDYTYNLFAGFGTEPSPGCCDKILNHIKEVVCACSEEKYQALINLLAWQIQNIGKPSRIITILKSERQQTGKGCLLGDILGVIYGNAGFITSEITQIVTRFNDTIRGKAYVFLDEALFAGDRKAANSIKSLSTCTRIGIESKGVPTIQLPVAVNLFLSTNHEDAAYIEEMDARYWILEVSDHRAGDTDYFGDLYEEIENGGREAFMHHIMNLDVARFIPSRDVPRNNESKYEMIRNSINPFDARRWIEECCETGMILGYKKDSSCELPYEKNGSPWVEWRQGEEYVNGMFFIAYTEWQKSVKSPVAAKPTGIKNFGVLLNEIGLVKTRNHEDRKRTLPDPRFCLQKLRNLHRN